MTKNNKKLHKKLTLGKSSKFLLKSTMFSAMLGSFLIGGSLLVTAKSDKSDKPSDSTCVEANYPARDANCKITDKYEIKSADNLVIFHYEFNSNKIELKGNDTTTIDTSDVCVVTSNGNVEAIYAMPDISKSGLLPKDQSCNTTTGGKTYTKYESRVYFYVYANEFDVGGKGIYHAANDGYGKPGSFRIYGNPEGGSAQTFDFKGNVCIDAFIYAPTATAKLSGGGGGAKCNDDQLPGITGAVWVNEWDGTGNAEGSAIHVPDNLAEALGDDIYRDGNTGLKLPKIDATVGFEPVERSN